MKLLHEKYSVSPPWWIECPQGFEQRGDRGKFVVDTGQKLTVTSGERCEARTGSGLFPPGSTRWIRWYTKFPAGFNPTPGTRWNIFTQWHQKPGLIGSPNVELHVNTTDFPFLELYVKGGVPAAWDLAPAGKIFLGPLRQQTVYRFVVGMSLSATNGWTRAVVNDGEWSGEVFAPNLYSNDDEGLYLKQGYYRPDNGPKTAILHWGTVVGETYEDVC